MKDVLKGVAIKVLSGIVIIALLLGGGYLLYNYIGKKIGNMSSHETVNDVQVIKEKLEEAAELNTGSYLCTDVITSADSKKFKDWKIPFTKKSFVMRYDGVVKAGIKNLAQAEVSRKGKTIVIKLPQVEITEVKIDNDSFMQLDESNNIFNPITAEDVNKAQKDLKEKMRRKAEEKGILDIAKSNAEALISGMVKNVDRDSDIKIEWK